MSLYDVFETDSDLEQKGINIDYGNTLITIARAGGSNKKYLRSLERRTKMYRRAIQTETMDNEVAIAVLREVYAESVILRWETRQPSTMDEDGNEVKGEMVVGIEADNGDILPFNAENVVLTLKNLPDLFGDIQEQASKGSLYRAAMLEGDSGN